jgi:hypothetical protein
MRVMMRQRLVYVTGAAGSVDGHVREEIEAHRDSRIVSKAATGWPAA